MGTHPIFESDFDCLTEMEWNTFVDDAKDMGTSIFETFSSAFNNAMGRDCSKNEHWTECDYCSEGNCQEPKMCPVCAGCLHENECVCDDGYVRNKDRQCVPENHCESIDRTCPENEHWVECDECTEDVCNGFPMCADCEEPTGQEYEPCCIVRNECVCDYGFYRYTDENFPGLSKCVPENECRAD